VGPIDWSTVNGNRTATGLGWAWAGPDTGRVGPVWAELAQTHVKRWLCSHGRLDSEWALARVGVAHGEQSGGSCEPQTRFVVD
jgi:hypothetical protein